MQITRKHINRTTLSAISYLVLENNTSVYTNIDLDGGVLKSDVKITKNYLTESDFDSDLEELIDSSRINIYILTYLKN